MKRMEYFIICFVVPKTNRRGHLRGFLPHGLVPSRGQCSLLGFSKNVSRHTALSMSGNIAMTMLLMMMQVMMMLMVMMLMMIMTLTTTVNIMYAVLSAISPTIVSERERERGRRR